MPDALIFDLDGTLWDTNAACAIAWNRVLARLGISYRPITEADIRAVAGRPHLDCVRTVLGDLDPETIVRVAAETEVEDNLVIAESGGVIYSGVRERTPGLASRVPLFIVSNCQSGYVEIFLETSGLAACFADFECWGNTRKTKSDNLRDLIRRNQIAQPWFVGDTEGDLRAARDCGVRFAFASYGFGDVSSHDHVLERFDQVAELLDG